MFHSSPLRVPAPCIINRGTIVNKQDMLSLLSLWQRVHYVYTRDQQVHCSGSATIAHIFVEPQRATVLANQALYLNLNSFDYLEIMPLDISTLEPQFLNFNVDAAVKSAFKTDLDNSQIDAHLIAQLNGQLEEQFNLKATSRFDLVQGTMCLSLIPIAPFTRTTELMSQSSIQTYQHSTLGSHNFQRSSLSDHAVVRPSNLAQEMEALDTLEAKLTTEVLADLLIEDLHQFSQHFGEPNSSYLSNSSVSSDVEKSCIFARLLAAKQDVETDSELWY